jgi:hypothetical protein
MPAGPESGVVKLKETRLPKSRTWLFTLNNVTDGQHFLDEARHYGANRAICQLEKAPETGTLHLQAFVGFETARHFAAIKKMWPTAHIEKCISAFASWQYCQKTETRVEGPWSFGDMPPARVDRSGEVKARNELLLQVGALKAVQDGLIPLRDFCKLDHCINEMQARLNKPKTLDHRLQDENTWYWGEPGTGKTSSVINRYEDDGLYLKPLNKWWNGYAYQ